jgi:hypothetical protein
MLVIVCEICPEFLGYVRDAKKLFCDEFYDGRCRFSVESEMKVAEHLVDFTRNCKK